MTKIVVLALDGATLDLLGPWMAAGELPLLARLYSEGVGGRLKSTVPWATPTAFASFLTGTNPGGHGVYDFGRLIGHDYAAFVPTNGGDVRGPKLGHLLTEAGLSSGFINMPMTYPAEAINGFVIAGIPYPGGSARLCHPPDLLTTLSEAGWDLARNASDDLGGDYAAYYDGLVDLVKARGEATAWLINEEKPDYLAVHFLETDQVQHRFWQFMPGEPKDKTGGRHSKAILRLFQETERAMTQIVDAAGPEAIICVMSDHGFGPTRQQVWLNNWLVQNGFLTLKGSLGVGFKKLIYRLGLSPAAIREMAPERLKLAILQFFERQKGRALASELEEDSAVVQSKGIMDLLVERLAIDFYDVDWSKTRAFSTGTTSVGYIWLNVAGRDPQGIVQPGAGYDQTRREIRGALLAWEPVGQVFFREEIWRGAQLEKAPDIVVQWADPSTDARYFQTRFSSHHLAKGVPNDYAGHRKDGLFLFHGPHIRPGTSMEADILDLAPTTLWLLGLPVPTYMDGRVLTECFDIDRQVETVKRDIQPDEDENSLSAGDEEAIMQSLRNLGYIE